MLPQPSHRTVAIEMLSRKLARKAVPVTEALSGMCSFSDESIDSALARAERVGLHPEPLKHRDEEFA